MELSPRITKHYTQINFCFESTHSAEDVVKWGPSPTSEGPRAELETARTWAEAGMRVSLVSVSPSPPNFSVMGHVHLVNIALSLLLKNNNN